MPHDHPNILILNYSFPVPFTIRTNQRDPVLTGGHFEVGLSKDMKEKDKGSKGGGREWLVEEEKRGGGAYLCPPEER